MYVGRGSTSVEVGHRVDRPLDALARPEQAPREQPGRSPVGRALGGARAVGQRRRRTVGDHVDLRRRRRRSRRSGGRGRSRSSRPRRRRRRRSARARALVRRRVRGGPCGRRRSTARERVEHVDDIVAVGAAVDAVLVLHDGDVGAVENVDGRGEPIRVPHRGPPETSESSMASRRHHSARHRPWRRSPRNPRPTPPKTWRCRRQSAGSWTATRTIGSPARRRRRGCDGCGDARRAPDFGSVEASSLRRATSRYGRPAQARRLFQEGVPRPYQWAGSTTDNVR